MFKKVLICKRCKEKTLHKRIGSSDNIIDDSIGFFRTILAIGSLGVFRKVSEMFIGNVWSVIRFKLFKDKLNKDL